MKAAVNWHCLGAAKVYLSDWNLQSLCGMIQHGQLTPAPEFLEVPKPKSSAIISDTVTSIASIAYMTRIRFAPTSKNDIFEMDDLKMRGASQEKPLSVGSKRAW